MRFARFQDPSGNIRYGAPLDGTHAALLEGDPYAKLIAYLSRDTTLLPGTLILTGTPPGVGFARKPPLFLADGDQISIEIDRIGVLENPVRDNAC